MEAGDVAAWLAVVVGDADEDDVLLRVDDEAGRAELAGLEPRLPGPVGVRLAPPAVAAEPLAPLVITAKGADHLAVLEMNARGDDVVTLQRDGTRHAEVAVVRLERRPLLAARVLDRARLIQRLRRGLPRLVAHCHRDHAARVVVGRADDREDHGPARGAAGDDLAVVQEISRDRVRAGGVGADRGADFIRDLGVADQIGDRRRRIDRVLEGAAGVPE